MWGKRNKGRHRPPGTEGRPDEWAPCEYLDDRERPSSDGDEGTDETLGWRAARHGRPEDWPSRPAPPPA